MINEIVVPPNPLTVAFRAVAQPIVEKCKQLELESEKLAAIRDALLPKLLSGEIRVAEAECFVGRTV